MLSIQKQTLLLTDFHYQEFVKYLKNSNAELSYKLITTIRSQKHQPDSDELCRLVYGDSEEKTRKKFLQLTHHTFKLSAFLSRNFPNYLKHNIQIIEQLLYEGKKQKANEIADWVVDISEKTEDFSTAIQMYKFLAQQASITETKDAVKLHKKINELCDAEKSLNEVYLYIRENLFFKGKDNISKGQLNKDLEFFDRYISSEYHAINILARFGKYYELSFLNHADFYAPETLKELETLEKDLLNNSFVTFHYLDDILFKIFSLTLQYDVNKTNTEAVIKETKKMNESSSFLGYWKSYVNVPELFSVSVQTSHYVSSYGFVFKENYEKQIPKDVRENVAYLKGKLLNEMNKPIWDDGYLIKLINIKCFYAALSLLGNREEKEKAVRLLEDTLMTYQQIPFQKFLDGIFVSLIMGYFSLQQYDKVLAGYKRYKKITAGHIVVKENDLTIDAYYYAAQYQISKRKQYIEKLENTYREAGDITPVKALVSELSRYYEIPTKLN